MLSALAYVGSRLSDHSTALSQPSFLQALFRLAAALRPDPLAASERMAADIIEAHGGRMTDAAEREIGQRFVGRF